MTALITGGSRGIGEALVREFAAAGYAVAFTWATNAQAAEAVVASLRESGATALAYQADVRDLGRAGEVVSDVEEKLGPLGVLVNNAGIRKDSSLMRMDAAAWQDVIDTNLTGTFNYTRAAIGGMMRQGGAIVNVTSVSGVIGMAGQTNYSASKAGVIGFTKALAREVARFGVRVNAIAPGFIETDMTATMDETIRKKLYAQIPLAKGGDAVQVAKLAVYLASPDAQYVTGQIWNIDGGLT